MNAFTFMGIREALMSVLIAMFTTKYGHHIPILLELQGLSFTTARMVESALREVIPVIAEANVKIGFCHTEI